MSRLDGFLLLAERGYPLTPVTIRRELVDGELVKRATFHGRWKTDPDAVSRDPEVVRDWFTQHDPETISFGIVTGPAGADGIDLDDKDGGPDWWAAQGLPVSAARVATPGGGFHDYWARVGAGTGTNAGKVARGVDARGVGGLLFAPGSVIVGLDGQVEDRGYVGDLPPVGQLAPMPAEVLALWTAARTPERPAGERREFTEADYRAYVDRQVVERLRDVREGARNEQLNMAAVSLGHFVPEFIAPDIARQVLEKHAPAGLTRDEVAKTIRSGLTFGMTDWQAFRVEDCDGEVRTGVPVPAELAGPDSWAPVDLGPILDGTVVRPEPSVGLARPDGVHFLYPGKEHSVVGETEAGKSWFALAHCAAELRAGNVVVYVHFEEEDATDTVLRLHRNFAVPGDVLRARFRFVGPARQIDQGAVDRLCAGQAPTLVVLDGQNEAMALHQQASRDDDGAAAYRARLVKPFTRYGAAVVSLDHVVKNPEQARQGVEMGSVMKGNGLSGARIALENQNPFGEGREGYSRIYVTKDRPGKLRKAGQPTKVSRKFYLGQLQISATGVVSLSSPVEGVDPETAESFDQAQQDRDEAAADEKVFQIVSAMLAKGLVPTITDIRASVRGRNTATGHSVSRLVTAGRLVKDMSSPATYSLPTTR